MIPGDFQFYKPPKNKLILFGFIGFVIFIVIALLATFHISSWIDKPVIFAAEAQIFDFQSPVLKPGLPSAIA